MMWLNMGDCSPAAARGPCARSRSADMRIGTMPVMSAALPTVHADAPPVLSEALLRRFDTPGPRYTSYPTADRFVEAFGAADGLRALEARAHGATVDGPAPL